MYGEMVALTNYFHSMPTKHKPLPQNFNTSIGLFSKAMVALMAMLFQNGTVGTTGPAMWLPGA